MTHPVLELQAADTMGDQLRYRREHLAERDQVSAARAALMRWEHERLRLRARLDELSRTIDGAEVESHEIDVHRARLDKQLRTVIAPREAEALQHEIQTLTDRRNALDDVELSALEEQARLDDELSALLGQEETLRRALVSADTALSASEVDIDGELARIAERREGLRAAVGPATLARYDGLRAHHLVAAATLSGSRCEGCHLDLSAAEVDEVKAGSRDGQPADCPQCGRLLVV